MPSKRETGLLTVAAIHRPKGRRSIECYFNERQRIFVLPPTVRGFEQVTKLLEESIRRKAPVSVALDLKRGVVERIEAPKPHVIEEFKRKRTFLEDPERSVRIKVSEIDPTIFNVVDRYLKWKCFRKCKKVIPNYKKAKQIFDFCAKQSCHLGGPYNITPCIPFQYVRDGCYARAHKMRWIITTKYRYCCEKVFSFANQYPQRLAVQANKWGGCCVTWWYHVAPLVRVRLGSFGVLAMVIDPGMFDKPVLLSTWLAAQENTNCDPNANVTMYSIQPGSAYWPANNAGTQFGTDPNYTQTDSTLNNYHNLTTCP